MPQVLLLEGAEGIGRQRLGLWLGQLLLCEKKSEEPCGGCRSCRLVAELGHADLHWIVPILRPKATDVEKQVDEAAELIGEIIAERRKNPLYGPLDGMASHPLATVRLIQRRAALKSVEGGPTVFIVGHAERLVVQESSPDAANAFLKLLEEPPANTWFLLTATEAGRLLPTIQSRVVPVRMARLADNEVREFLAAEMKPAPAGTALDERVRLAEGSIGAAIGASEAGAKAYAAAADLIDVALKGPAARAERTLKQGTWSARGEFSAMLDALEHTLVDATRVATGVAPRRTLPTALKTARPVARLLEAQQQVVAAREAAQGNVNPQLLVAVLAEELAAALNSGDR